MLEIFEGNHDSSHIVKCSSEETIFDEVIDPKPSQLVDIVGLWVVLVYVSDSVPHELHTITV